MSYRVADEGARPRHKRRTPKHNKHVVWPGMRTPKDVTIVSGSIKGKTNKNAASPPGKGSSYNDPMWTAYDVAAKKLGNYGSSSPLAIRRTTETEYSLAYFRLQKAGKILKLKSKYAKR